MHAKRSFPALIFRSNCHPSLFKMLNRTRRLEKAPPCFPGRPLMTCHQPTIFDATVRK